MAKKTIQTTDVAGKRVLVRVDFNVPLKDGEIADDRRIQAALPTIKNILDRGGSVVLISHLGRPGGKGYEKHFSLEPIAVRLGELLGKSVLFPSHDCVDDEAKSAVENLASDGVVLLENLRFHADEKAGSESFARKLAAYGQVYVNDAFGACHRSDASMVALPMVMEGKPRVVGTLVEKEITFLHDTIKDPAKPFVIVLGGAKVSDKLGAIENLLPRADDVIIGGAMAYTFLAALGQQVGESRIERDRMTDAKRIIQQAAHLGVNLHLPSDHICSTQFLEDAGDIEVFEDTIKPGYMGLDIGPETQSNYAEVIRKGKTIVWNGPMGVFEWVPFRVGTEQIAKAMVYATENGATTIVGGGDSAAAVDQFGLAERFSHVSTGGGASLAMLEGKPFKAVDVLDDA